MENNDNHSFTLIELLLVVSIIGILTAIAVPNFLDAQIRAKLAYTHAQINTLRTSINAYTLDHRYPPLTTCPQSPFCKDQYIGLTTPVAYLTDFSACRDLFAPDIELGGAYFEDLHYWYYGSILNKKGEPMFYHRDQFALMSWGPDRQAYVWVTLSRFMSRRDGRKWIRPYLYSPTNGLRSHGDIIVTNAKRYDR